MSPRARIPTGAATPTQLLEPCSTMNIVVALFGIIGVPVTAGSRNHALGRDPHGSKFITTILVEDSADSAEGGAVA